MTSSMAQPESMANCDNNELKRLQKRKKAARDIAIKRIQQELKELKEEPIPHYSIIGPVDNDLFHWQVTLHGPKDSPYEGGIFRLCIEFPIEYPSRPPKLRFLTKIYHCNVLNDGTVYGIDDLKDENCMGFVLIYVYDMLKYPNPSTAQKFKVSQQYTRDPSQYDHIARNWTQQYAVDGDDSILSYVDANVPSSSTSSLLESSYPIEFDFTSSGEGRTSEIKNDTLSTGTTVEDSLGRILHSTENKVVRKSVSFSLRKRIRKIHYLCSASNENVEDFWFRPNDIAVIKTSAKKMASLLDKGVDHTEEVESTRGLEHMGKDGALARLVHKRCAYDAVFNEQRRQKKDSVEDPHLIAQLYQDSNKKCVDIALKKAELDEKVAKEYLEDRRRGELECLTNNRRDLKNLMADSTSETGFRKLEGRMRLEFSSRVC